MIRKCYIICSDEQRGMSTGRVGLYVQEAELISVNDDDEGLVRHTWSHGGTSERWFDEDEYFYSELEAYKALKTILEEDLFIVNYRIGKIEKNEPYYWTPGEEN